MPSTVLLFAAGGTGLRYVLGSLIILEPLRDSNRAKSTGLQGLGAVSLHCWQGHTSRKYFQE